MVGVLAPLGGHVPFSSWDSVSSSAEPGGTLTPHRLILLAKAGVGEEMTLSWSFPSFFKLML